ESYSKKLFCASFDSDSFVLFLFVTIFSSCLHLFCLVSVNKDNCFALQYLFVTNFPEQFFSSIVRMIYANSCATFRFICKSDNAHVPKQLSGLFGKVIMPIFPKQFSGFICKNDNACS